MELFRPDMPIDSKIADRFQRYEFGKRIARIASEGKYSSSLVIGLYGKWGEGKTSVLNFIRQEIPKEIVQVDFNPWNFNDEKSLLKSFFEAIASSLGRRLEPQRKKILKSIGDYAEGIGAVAEIAHVPGLWIKMAKSVIPKLKEKSLQELKQVIDSFIVDANLNIVVFIDDIDRLQAEEIQSVFKLVKLVGDFPRTSYVLPFDDEMVAAALAPKYGSKEKKAGYEFLEKIIQVPLQLPKASPLVLKNYTIELLNDALSQSQINLPEHESNEFILSFDRFFLPVLINPRIAGRYANAIGFCLPLLKGEVFIIDLIIIEGIKVFFPAVYYLIRNNPQYFIRKVSTPKTEVAISKIEIEEIKSAIDTQLSVYPLHKKNIQEMLQELFPQLDSIYGNRSYDIGVIRNWYMNKRICSPQYFERYFSYVVQTGDISDIQFADFLSTLADARTTDYQAVVKAALPDTNTENLLFKLEQISPSFNQKQSTALALMLAQMGNHFSSERIFAFYSQWEQVGNLIKQLLKPVNYNARVKCCIETMSVAQPFSFAVKINTKFVDRSRHVQEDEFLKPVALKDINEQLVNRFIEINKTEDFFTSMPEDAIWIIFTRFAELERLTELQNILSGKLAQSNANALNIIRAVTPNHYNTSRGNADLFKAGFEEENYQELKKYSDISLLYKKTVELYGNLTFKLVRDPKNDELIDINLVALFQQYYREENG